MGTWISEMMTTPTRARAQAAQVAAGTGWPCSAAPTGTITLMVDSRNPARVELVCSSPYACAAVPAQFSTLAAGNQICQAAFKLRINDANGTKCAKPRSSCLAKPRTSHARRVVH